MSSQAGGRGRKRIPSTPVPSQEYPPKRLRPEDWRHLECPVCFELFDADDRKPKLLTACGHSVCEGCGSRLVRNGRATCPICREEGRVGARGLPTNYSLAGLAASARRDVDQADRTPEVACKECSKLVSLSEAWLCQGSSSTQGRSSKAREKKCDRETAYLLCPSCSMENHRNHLIVRVVKLVEQRQREVRGQLSPAEESMARAEEGLGGTQDELQSLEHLEPAVDRLPNIVKSLEHQRDVLAQRLGPLRNRINALTSPTVSIQVLEELSSEFDFVRAVVEVKTDSNRLETALSHVSDVASDLHRAASDFAEAINVASAAINGISANFDIPPAPAMNEMNRAGSPGSPPVSDSDEDEDDDDDEDEDREDGEEDNRSFSDEDWDAGPVVEFPYSFSGSDED